MTQKRPYSYTVLRYVHDVMTGEFINVGIVLHVPPLGLQSRMRTSIGRLRNTFPDLDRSAFTSAMRSVRRSLDRLGGEIGREGLIKGDGDAIAFACKAVPADDSSLQWSSPAGTGLTDDPTKTLERLYERFVGRYDTRSVYRRTDDDIWRPVRQKLEAKQLAGCLQEKVISGGVDEIAFKHAWKNGQWHVYEPVSFDLADADGIKTKAREWLGHLSAVVADGDVEQFKPHFIVGAPTKPELNAAYASAITILRKAPFQPEIFEESQVDDLVAQIEDDVRAHEVPGSKKSLAR